MNPLLAKVLVRVGSMLFGAMSGFIAMDTGKLAFGKLRPIGTGMELSRDKWPRFVNNAPNLKAIYIERCAYGAKLHSFEMAHAHICGKHKGTICIKHTKDLTPITIFHELAHLNAGVFSLPHGKRWRDELRKLCNQFGMSHMYEYEMKYCQEGWKAFPWWKQLKLAVKEICQ